MQASDSHDQAQASASDDKVQDQQQVCSSSSQPNDQSNASNQVQVLQLINVAHPLDSIIGDISRGMQTRSRLTSFYEYFSFVSSVELKKIDEALLDIQWVKSLTTSQEIKYGSW